jgi:AraC-like DNA-binding protein
MPIELLNVVHHRQTYPDEGSPPRKCVHTTCALALYLEGKATGIAGAEAFSLSAPWLGLVAAGEVDKNVVFGRCEAFWCAFESDWIRAVPGGLLVEAGLGGTSIRRSHQKPLNGTQAAALVPLFQSMHDISRRPDLASRLRAQACLQQLLAAWCEPPADAAGHQSKAYLYSQLIEEHATDADLSLTQLAEKVGLCPNHLTQLFREEFGIAPVEYRTRIRLALARELLCTSNLPVREIARRSGFADANYFARAFRLNCDVSPGEYRQNHSKTFM